jgi:hypothetical protein
MKVKLYLSDISNLLFAHTYFWPGFDNAENLYSEISLLMLLKWVRMRVINFSDTLFLSLFNLPKEVSIFYY